MPPSKPPPTSPARPATRPSGRLPVSAICAPGLEPLLAAELGALGIRRPRVRRGGVGAEVSVRQLYAANVQVRTATRLVVRVQRFEARTFAELEDGVRGADWGPWLDPDIPVRLRVSSIGSRLYHRDAIAERVLGVLGNPPAFEDDADDEQLLIVRVAHDEVTISVDSSGRPLHQRGWRGPHGKAPLRETLAAALVLASGWDPATPLVDPMCGSGTIAIEAARLARGIPPGLDRDFGFVRWPSFEPGTWASVAGEARAAVERGREGPAPRIVARDRDAGVVEATRVNAAAAGVADDVDVAVAAISHLEPPAGAAGPGWLLTNPPYGTRVGGGDLRDLYARTGEVVRRFPGWSVGLLVADRALAGQLRLDWSPALRTANGGLPVELLTATVPDAPSDASAKMRR